MIRKFLKDIRGNYLIATAIGIVPLMGAVALAVDFSEMSRERQAMLNALDAANLAAGRYLQTGAKEEDVLVYARQFFDANLGPVKPSVTTLETILPNNNYGGGTLKSTACLNYSPYFYPVFKLLLTGDNGGQTIRLCAESEVRLKNTLEVALVLDNSGSMDDTGKGSGKKRLELLKTASKQLVDTIAAQAGMMKQVSKPVQFGVVPFAASVNVGPQHETASWMDTTGASPVHYENFNLSKTTGVTIGSNKEIRYSNGAYRKIGNGWPSSERNTVFTRFTLLKDIEHYTNSRQTSTNRTFTWDGCVEARPHPYNIDDTSPSASNAETMFVPMFAPDEAGEAWNTSGTNYTLNAYRAPNSWWNDLSTSNASTRQNFLRKYYTVRPYGKSTPSGKGPNYSCTTTAITPLTDVTDPGGLSTVKAAIDGMVANGATNVPEGLAWGWRVVSSGEPFTQGRSESERGNDKVVIVLTDGANTYYTPGSLGFSDSASNQSTYSALGYAGTGRIFDGTKVSRWSYSNSNYTKAMNETFATLCDNVKDANLIVMTVALDLSSTNSEEKAQIDALKACSSDSRFRRDPSSPGKAAKLFWNTTGGELEKTFEEIADELSNLRIIS